MAGIFDDKKMMKVLENYIPSGETLKAGVHVVANELSVTRFCKGCKLDGDKVVKIESDNPQFLKVTKSKYAQESMYFGITENNLVFCECQPCKYMYEFDDVSSVETSEEEIAGEYKFIRDIGHCIPLSEVERITTKKIWFGALKCTITLKNATYFKLLMPKRGGLNGGMPHHEEYRDAIIACLNDCVMKNA